MRRWRRKMLRPLRSMPADAVPQFEVATIQPREVGPRFALLGVEHILADMVLVRDAGYGDRHSGARVLFLEEGR